MVLLQWELMVSNNILAFFVGLLGFILQQFIQWYAYQSHYSALHIFGEIF